MEIYLKIRIKGQTSELIPKLTDDDTIVLLQPPNTRHYIDEYFHECELVPPLEILTSEGWVELI